MAKLMKCPHCGKFIDRDVNICPKCSQPLVEMASMKEENKEQEKAVVPKQEASAPTPSPVRKEHSEQENSNYNSPNPVRVATPEDEYKVVAESCAEEPESSEQQEEKAPTYVQEAPIRKPAPKEEPKPQPIQAQLLKKEERRNDISSDRELEAFYASMKKEKSDEKKEKPKEEDEGESKAKKLASFAGNFANNLVNNSKAIIGKSKPEPERKHPDPEEDTEEDVQKTIIRRERKKASEECSKNTYNANEDGYYNYVTAEIDARTEHVTTEMVIKTISFIAIVIVIVVGMINFI